MEAPMRRTTLFLALLLFCPALDGVAQEAAHVYEAYYKVKIGDLPEWNNYYFEHAVPVLEQLQSEGIIEGWNQWQHMTGGEYNIRFAIRAFDWAAYDTFWAEYLARTAAASSGAETERIMRMIQGHYDEVWDIGYVDLSEGAETAYMYASTYQFNFADTEEWNRIWMDVVGPNISAARDEGLVNGWVVLNHNTGGTHNFKVLYMFDEWDHIDDFFERVLGSMAEANPEDAQKFGQMVVSHDDLIWVPTTSGGM
jgi:hypothetical protein